MIRLARLACSLAMLVAGLGCQVERANPGPPAATFSPALTLEALRQRPFQMPRLARDGTCPATRGGQIGLAPSGPAYRGTGPFYLGEYIGAGDLNKVPWAVDPRYLGPLVVRGRQIDGSALVNFGFWPAGFGTPAARPDVPVSFTRPDQQGRTVVYQPELDIDPTATSGDWRRNGHFWSFPRSGCYAIQADGETFRQTIVVPVGS